MLKPGAVFSTNLKRIREAAGLTQEALAARMGVRQSAISNLEKGSRGLPTGETLVKLAIALACSVDALLVGLVDTATDEVIATRLTRAAARKVKQLQKKELLR